jgi:hypothetical protein
MIVCPVREDFVQRDMDLIREILLRVEANQRMDGRTEFVYQSPEEMGISGHSLEEIAYHAKLLIEDHYLKGNLSTGYTMPSIRRLTNAGHDFLDNIRDAGIWSNVKNRIGDLQHLALPIIAAVAESEVKRHLGL